MATKYIILIIIGVLFIVYNVFFNDDKDDSYLRGFNQLGKILASMIVALFLALITLIIF